MKTVIETGGSVKTLSNHYREYRTFGKPRTTSPRSIRRYRTPNQIFWSCLMLQQQWLFIAAENVSTLVSTLVLFAFIGERYEVLKRRERVAKREGYSRYFRTSR